MLPELAGVPGVGGVPRICGCTREPTMHPGSLGAAGGWRVFPGQSMLPQPAGTTGASECSPG